MYLLINTSDSICRISLIKNEWRVDDVWQSDRNLAKFLLKHLHELLTENNLEWFDITSIGVFSGPGSFTGLRIGITVMNTLADSLNVPIIGAIGENWQEIVFERLKNNENDKIVLPNYGSDAKITTPKK